MGQLPSSVTKGRRRIKHPAARKLQPQRITLGELNAILKRLQCIDNWSKRFGCRMGLVGDNGFKVWRYLAYGYMAKGWACFPSYKWIAGKCNIARSTVGEALARLRRIGALTWTERVHRVNGRRVQGTNVFEVRMPGVGAEKLPLMRRSSSKPVHFPEIRRETDKRTHGAETVLKNDRLGHALGKLAAAVVRKAERLRREESSCGKAELA